MSRQKFLENVSPAATGWPVVTTLWPDGQATALADAKPTAMHLSVWPGQESGGSRPGA